jgi:hypothetical protein
MPRRAFHSFRRKRMSIDSVLVNRELRFAKHKSHIDRVFAAAEYVLPEAHFPTTSIRKTGDLTGRVGTLGYEFDLQFSFAVTPEDRATLILDLRLGRDAGGYDILERWFIDSMGNVRRDLAEPFSSITVDDAELVRSLVYAAQQAVFARALAMPLSK